MECDFINGFKSISSDIRLIWGPLVSGVISLVYVDCGGLCHYISPVSYEVGDCLARLGIWR